MYNTAETSSDLPAVSSRQQGATEVRVFLLEHEKEALKLACAANNVQMSHQIRLLVLEWLNNVF